MPSNIPCSAAAECRVPAVHGTGSQEAKEAKSPEAHEVWNSYPSPLLHICLGTHMCCCCGRSVSSWRTQEHPGHRSAGRGLGLRGDGTAPLQGDGAPGLRLPLREPRPLCGVAPPHRHAVLRPQAAGERPARSPGGTHPRACQIAPEFYAKAGGDVLDPYPEERAWGSTPKSRHTLLVSKYGHACV